MDLCECEHVAAVGLEGYTSIAMAPMLLTAVESVAEGATKEQVEAAWAHVNSCMVKVPGFTRQ